MVHELKTWKPYYQDIIDGLKSFEIRINDRNYQKGHTLLLKEWDNVRCDFTGRMVARKVRYILEGGQFGIEEGYIVMSIK